MTTEEKELLFKDLCARLPYHPIIYGKEGISTNEGVLTTVTTSGVIINTKGGNHHYYFTEEIKPYLRPMSSMTNREKAEYTSLRSKGGYDWDEYEADKLITWLDKNMFDHRGLIKKDLALPLSPEQ